MKTYFYYQESYFGITEQIVNAFRFYDEIAYDFYKSACLNANIDAKELWTNYNSPLILKATQDCILDGAGCGLEDQVFEISEGEIAFLLHIEDIDKLNSIYKEVHGVTFLDHHTIWEYTEELDEYFEYLELN